MATVIEISSNMNEDREALFAWANLPQQREKYPDFEGLLYALPYSRQRYIDDGSSHNVTYIQLNVPRKDCKSLFIRLSPINAERGPKGLTVINQKEDDGFGGGNCFGWEEARDLLVKYMALKGASA
jgi:hypothetical protein